MRLDLPLPLTPVTHVSRPRGTSAVTARRLWARAPTTRTHALPRALRLLGTGSCRLPLSHGPGYSNTKELGRLLYTEYVYPFEIAAVILLVAIVAAIALTLRRRKNAKTQDPAQQVRVRRQDRVRLVSMAAEKPEAAANEE